MIKTHLPSSHCSVHFCEIFQTLCHRQGKTPAGLRVATKVSFFWFHITFARWLERVCRLCVLLPSIRVHTSRQRLTHAAAGSFSHALIWFLLKGFDVTSANEGEQKRMHRIGWNIQHLCCQLRVQSPEGRHCVHVGKVQVYYYAALLINSAI